MKRYKFLGTENIDCICDYCGRQEISKAFIVEDLENGRILKFGSTCIKKALDITMPEIKAEFSKHLESFFHDCHENQYPIWKEMDAIMKAYRKEHNYPFGTLPESEERYWELHRQYQEIEKQMSEEKRRYEV
jgi:hypothetical protein